MVNILLILGVLHVAYGKLELTEENNVAVLSKDVFDNAITEYEYVMVEFYAPWCGHCKALQPEYEKAAELLKASKLDVLLAKVDATVETELASSHGVSGYPTLKFHKSGSWINYNGERNADAIVNWIKRKTQPALRILESVTDLESFIKSADVVVVGFVKDSPDTSRLLEEVADELDSFSFGVISNQEAFDKYGVKQNSQITVFKAFDEGRVDFTQPIEKQSLTQFIQVESISLVVEFSQEQAGKVFGSPVKKHLVAFAPKQGPFEEIKSKLEAVSKKFKGKLHFILIDTDIEDHQRIVEFFGMTQADVPGYRVIDLGDDMTKFKPETSDFDEQVMETFVNGVLSGTVRPFLMSQSIPADSNEPVRELVGLNYNTVTQDESKAVFVKLYAPWCGHCKNLAPIWEKLGEEYKNREDLIIAKMDATANEAEGLKVNSFPTLKYYPKGSKNAIEYSGDRTFDALKEFLDADGKTDATGKTEEPKDEL